MRVLLTMIAAGAAATLIAAVARTPILASASIEPGSWQLRNVDDSTPPQRVCINDAYDLIQIRHPGVACSRFVLSNEPRMATVHYTCTGAGYGRTTIKVETEQLIRVESQGLVNRAPFELALEGRRVGGCTPEHASR